MAVEFMQIGQPDFIAAVQALRQYPQSQNMRKSGVDRSQLFRTHRTLRPGQLQPFPGVDGRRGRRERKIRATSTKIRDPNFFRSIASLCRHRDLATKIQWWLCGQRIRSHQVQECRRIAGQGKHQAPQ